MVHTYVQDTFVQRRSTWNMKAINNIQNRIMYSNPSFCFTRKNIQNTNGAHTHTHTHKQIWWLWGAKECEMRWRNGRKKRKASTRHCLEIGRETGNKNQKKIGAVRNERMIYGKSLNSSSNLIFNLLIPIVSGCHVLVFIASVIITLSHFFFLKRSNNNKMRRKE